jgi:hypothetical protein
VAVYYRLRIDVAGMSQYWELENNEDLRLGLGISVDVEEDQIELPFRLKVSYHPGLDGNPKVQPLYDYVTNVKVMTKRLVAAIQSAGVDNLQIFPAVVTDSVSGAKSEEYVVINVLGLVSGVNLARSVGTPVANAFYFDKIAIDPAKVRDLLLFRIKESPIEIIVHDSVAKVISDGKFEGVTLESASSTPPGP